MTETSTPSAATIRGRWQLDGGRSHVGFRVRLLWGLATVKGHFESYQGTLDLGADPAIELTIDATSLQTGNRRRDKHLRSADFFDVDSHPQVQFVAESVEPSGDRLKVRGWLSARGTAIPLTLEAQVRDHGDELEIETTVRVAHRELGMTFSPLGMVPPHSDVSVRAYLIPDPFRAGASRTERPVSSDV